MKNLIGMLMIGMLMTASVQAQMAYTYSGKDLLIKASTDDKVFTKETDAYNVILNKVTGEIRIDIPVEYLTGDETAQSFNTGSWHYGEMISITGVIPIDELLQSGADQMDVLVESDVLFNGHQYKTEFTFNIFNMQRNEFMVYAEGRMQQVDLGLGSLEKAADEVLMALRFHAG